MKAGFVCFEPTKELSGDRRNEEDAIMTEGYLSDHSVMLCLKQEFIKEHNALLALSTHGPMLVEEHAITNTIKSHPNNNNNFSS